jgi:hypothetical protein
MNDFNTTWQHIKECEGQTFATSGGQPFAYDVEENGLSIRRSDLFLNKENIESALTLRTPVASKQLAAYISGILNDVRIRG